MSSLRERIQIADKEREKLEMESEQFRLLKIREEARNVELANQSKETMLAQAKGHFNKYLMPIFKEVASAKKIFIYESKFHWLESTPIGIFIPSGHKKSWFNVGEGIADDGSVFFGGNLGWNYESSRSFESWRELDMSVTNLGDVLASFCPEKLNLLRGDYTQLYENVEKLMVQSGGEFKYINSSNDSGGQ